MPSENEILGPAFMVAGPAMQEAMSLSHATPAIETQAAVVRPLCVDLDGTLVKSDTLIDSLLILARSNPLVLLRLAPLAVASRAGLKQRVSSLVSLDVKHLPYNRRLLTFLQQQHDDGRAIYLTTGADAKLAERIAVHLGIFAGVLSSDGTTNLTGHAKLERLRHSLAGQQFDYVGNARPDLPLLLASMQPMVANPDYLLRGLIRTHNLQIHRRFEDRSSVLQVFPRAIRIHQWAKNALMFVPLLLAHALNRPAILKTLLAFLCFSLCASANYIINDLLDVESDRRHPQKRNRAFASGNLPAAAGLAIAAAFLCLASVGLHWLPPACLGWFSVYFASTLSYSLWFKRVVLVDVLVLSGLYTLRMLAGAAATGIQISPWLAGFSLFLFLSLAMVKRFSELQNLRASGLTPRNGRAYMLVDIDQLRSFGTSSGYASVIIFILYVNSHEVTSLYQYPKRLWLIAPLLILWISWVWLLASRGELDEDPVIFALSDRMSLLIGAAVSLIAFFAV
jgi:4-hydroxybenzoate polyprenyltransferase/phosphoserine phosphatase